MARSRLIGAARVRRLLRVMPDEVRSEISRTLEASAKLILAAMRARTPRKTGALQAALSWKSYLKGLRVRVGLLTGRKRYARQSANYRKGSYQPLDELFYGRIQNFGREAKRVLVERRGRLQVQLQTRRSRKIGVVSKYYMNVRAMPAKRFITGPYPEFKRIVGQRLRGIWDRALNAAGGGNG